MSASLTLRGIEVLAAPGVSEHLDFVNAAASYEEQLRAAGKAYLDWYMLRQVAGRRARSTSLQLL